VPYARQPHRQAVAADPRGGGLVTPETGDRVGRDPAWVRAPWWFMRSWGSAVAVGLAVAVAAMVAGAAPLFLVVLGDEVFARQVAGSSAEELGATVSVTDLLPDPERLTIATALLGTELAPEGVFGPAGLTLATRNGWNQGWVHRLDADDPQQLDRIVTGEGDSWTAGGRGAVRLAASPRLLDDVEVVWAAGGAGVWVTDTVAAAVALTPGDAVLLYLGGREPSGDDGVAGPRLVVEVPVAGVYVDPWTSGRLDEAWQQLPEWVAPRRPTRGDGSSQQLLLTDADTLAAIAVSTGAALRASWSLPLAGEGLRLAEGIAAVESLLALEERTAASGSDLAVVVRSLHPDGLPPTVSSGLPEAIAAARTGQDAVRAQVQGIGVAGVLLSLGMVAAAGIFVTRRRATEVRLADGEGTSVWALAGRSVVELLPPVVLGVLVGWMAALGVALPSRLRSGIDPSWVLATGAAAVIAGLVGLAGLAVAVAVTARRLVRLEGETASAGPVTALVASAATTVASGFAVAGHRAGTPAGVLVQAFPVLLAVSVSLAGVLVLARLVGRVHLEVRSVAVDLALLRVRRSLRTAIPLVVATALSAALLLYVGVLASSVASTTEDKAAVLAGGSSAVELSQRYSELPDLPEGTEVVLRSNGVVTPGRSGAVLLAVDATTLARTAPWGPALGSYQLGDALAELPTDLDEHVAVLAVGGTRELGQEVFLDAAGAVVRGRIVVERTVFPGLSLSRPTYVVDRDRWIAAVTAERVIDVDGPAVAPDPTVADPFRVELWSTSTSSELVARTTAAGLTPTASTGAAVELQEPRLLAQTISLRFLTLLGAVASLLALTALVLYVSARQRERHLAFALSERMGLTAAAHRRAVAYELALLCGLALLLGLPAGVLGARTVVRSLDPLPSVPPAVPVIVPGGLLVVIPLVSLTLALVAAVVAQHHLRRASTNEVLRVAD
jgi:putative ABC transport system permease protein